MALIRLKEVMACTGLGRSSVYKFMNEGRFPKSVQLGDRAIAFVATEIEDWVQEKIDLRDESAQLTTVKETKLINEADVITFLKNKFKQLSVADAIAWLIQVLK